MFSILLRSVRRGLPTGRCPNITQIHIRPLTTHSQHNGLTYCSLCTWNLSRAFSGTRSSCFYSTRTVLETEEKLKISEIFPRPLNALHAIEVQVANKLGGPSLCSMRFKKRPDCKICELEVTWPENRIFTASARKKATAKTKAALQALEWLYSSEVITKDLRLKLPDVAKLKNTVHFDFNEAERTKIDSILLVHSKDVVPVLSKLKTEGPTLYDDIEKHPFHPTLGVPFPCPEDLALWNDALSLNKSTPRKKTVLPIDNYRQTILETVKNNRITIVKGETGCGKTTRVPQFILEEEKSEGRGAFCNIAVVQPRRLTTMQTAKYVAYEQGENIGKSIGYNVKMATKFPSVVGGSITFLTGFKLAHKFTRAPSLQGVSHVVLDEVHMRDIGIDLVMTLLKQAMKLNENLRVIIMSATVNTSIFQSFFSCYGHVPVIEVPGRTFPVKMHFLNDLPSNIVTQRNYDGDELEVDIPLVQRVVSWINKTKPAGAILIFVSGWNDMYKLQKSLSYDENLLIIPVHSMFRDSSAAFEPAPQGKRKVILATNIAETSLTFCDVVYVVDCGIHKKPQRELLTPEGWSSSRLNSEWITKANVLQRRGRAGRVQPGESYHLFPKETFDEMEDYELPSIMCESLEYLVLTIKMVNPDVKADDLLKSFPTPPSPKDVRQAVQTLQKVSLLSYDDEKPTPLASAVMKISSSLPSALALIYSAIFRCVDLTSSMVTSEETGLRFREQYGTSSELRSIKTRFHDSSDHLALAIVINNDPELIKMNHQARALKQFLNKQVRAMSDSFSTANLNEHSSQELALSVLMNCFGSLLLRCHGKSLQTYLIDKSGVPARIKNRSVNYKFEKSKSPFFLYLSARMSTSRDQDQHLNVDDTSVVSPLSVLLFLPSNFHAIQDESNKILVKAWWKSNLTIVISDEDWLRIEGLQKAFRDVRDYFVTAEALNQPDDNLDLMCEFRNQLIECLNEILAAGRSQIAC